MVGEKWKITINRHRGFAPKWYENTYPSYGNRDQAGDMKDVSLLDPSALTPGPRIVDLTAGDEDGAVTENIKSILGTAVSSNATYGVGGTLLHKLSATAVSNAGIWPHTIVGTGAVNGEDVVHYKGALLYSLNDAGAAGDIGRYDLSTTFDDTYWTGTLSGSALSNAPHQMMHGGDDVVYITNGQYIANLDGTTENHQALDFWTDAQVDTLTWNYNRVLAGVNRPALSGVNVNQSAIYKWNGYASTWEGDPIEINGRIGALFTKNGITYVWYEGFLNGTTRLVFGMVSGGQVKPLRTFDGTLPTYYQVGEMGEYITWMSGSEMYAWGPVSSELPIDLMYFTTAKYATTVGGMAAPFGTAMIASTAGSNFSLGKATNYSIATAYKTIMFPVSGANLKSIVDTIVINTNVMADGAKMDLTVRDSQGTALWTDEISYTTDGAVSKKVFHPRCKGEDLRLEFSHANGSTTNPVKVRQTIIEGRNIPSH